MKTNTREKIINYIKIKQKARPHDLFLYLNLSHVAIHKLLKKLVTDGILTKTGKPPFVYYQLAPESSSFVFYKKIPKKIVDFINENYLYVSPSGEMLFGIEGFFRWVKKINQEKLILALANEYFQYVNQINKKYKKNGLIEATFKLKNTFKNDFAIEKVFFLDFYSYSKFGKTKVGQLVFFAKQSQNLSLIKKLVDLSKKKIVSLINQKRINAISFIPHTIPRKIQFLKEFEKLLNLPFPKISLIKAYKDKLLVPQKSLNTLEDRIINAKETIFIKDYPGNFDRVLLIDDAVGSGASMNETAKKLKKEIGSHVKIYSFALVGSLKGFDVIKEI